MKHLHLRQQKILESLLERNEGATADELVEIIGITKTAVKDHLSQLEHLGYISYRDEKGAVGRPRRFYLLSDQGIEAFPRQYSWLSTALLEQVSESFSANEISVLLEGLAEKMSAPLQVQLKSLSEKERLKLIVKTMNELGYRAQLKETDTAIGAIIEATNCVYHTVAQKNPELCQFDISLLKRTSKLKVKLETCIARGGATCRFCLKR
jgi:DeoR family suf operon transcriptional repressor